MRTVTRRMFVGTIGAAALMAGFLIGRGDREGGSSDPLVVAAEDEKISEERIHPELLDRLRKADVAAKTPKELVAEDFPDAFIDAVNAEQLELGKLLERWAEVDLDGMMEHFLWRGTFRQNIGASSIYEMGGTVIRLVAMRDPLKAWEFAKRFPKWENARKDALRHIGHKDPELAVELALADLNGLVNQNTVYGSRGGIDLGKDVNRKLAMALAKREPFGDIECAVLREIDFDIRLGGSELINEIWGALPAEQKARMATALVPNKDDGSDAAGEIYRAAREQFASGESGDTGRFYKVFAGRILEESSLAEAVEWTKGNLGKRNVWPELSLLFAAAADAGVPRADILAQVDPGDPSMAWVAGKLVRQSFEGDRDGALEWVAALGENDVAGKAAQELARQYLGSSTEEIVAAATKLGEMGGAFLNPIAMEQFSSLGGQAGVAWAQSLPEDFVAVGVGTVVQQWTNRDPVEAWEYVRTLPSDAPHQVELVELAAGAMLMRDDEQRASWIAGLDGTELQQARRVVLQSVNNRQWREARLAELDAAR